MADESAGFFDRWAARRLGVPPEKVTLDLLVRTFPRRRRLNEGDTGSPLGGKIDDHLERLSDDEMERLADEGERFLEEAPCPPADAKPRAHRE